jgi:F0F1-type ATP synthase membrane subunit c/vacuolar-type H+-ATPase subunit K
MHKLCINYAEFTQFMQLLLTLRCIMQFLCRFYAVFMQFLLHVYAKFIQILCRDPKLYTKLQKVCFIIIIIIIIIIILGIFMQFYANLCR